MILGEEEKESNQKTPDCPLTHKQRRDLYEIWRKVNGIQVQLVRLLGELDISIRN